MHWRHAGGLGGSPYQKPEHQVPAYCHQDRPTVPQRGPSWLLARRAQPAQPDGKDLLLVQRILQSVV